MISFDRRQIIAGAMFAFAESAAAHPSRVKAIGWRGSAQVIQADTVLDLTVDTRVEPFRRARSRSWITRQGETTARTLVIEPTVGWLEQGGQRKPLPPTLIAHERQQYGLYGYLLRAMQASSRSAVVNMTEPGYPPIRLELAHGRVTAADYVVNAAEDGLPLAQRFVFEGTVDRMDQRWFRRMTIFHAGQRYFDLTIAELIVERD